MIPQEIIARKRDGHALSETDIQAFVKGALDGAFADYQTSALLMAILLKGMDAAETAALTRAMMHSGDVITLEGISRPKIDKHSTGGVGDKVSLILTPLVVAAGLCVPMISGRGLGHTGGTLDKLEAIPGFRTDLDEAAYRRQVGKVQQAIIAQTDRMVPADRHLYALRDVTATVESIPLICASILSKKLAEGIDALVLDVKVGQGAFMKTLPDARALAEALVGTCRELGKPASALITRMDEPLGHSVGNALEVAESIACLRGEGPADLMEVTYALGAEMLRMAGMGDDLDAHVATLQSLIQSGEALTHFQRLVEAQGGDPATVEHPDRLLPQARSITACAVPSDVVGQYISGIDAQKVGEAARLLGAGRANVSAKIDPAVGLSHLAKVGTRVSADQPLAQIHANGPAEAAAARLIAAFSFAEGPPATSCGGLVVERIGVSY